MSKKITVNTGPSFGLLSLVFIVLLVLKLTGLATLSWWWVFSPLMIIPIIALLILGCTGLVIAGISIYEAIVKHKRNKERARIRDKLAK